jgi:hypothetical protein
MLHAIAAGKKKKNDRVDARKIADLPRCSYFPECHMASREIRDRRRVLRYRNLLVRQAELAPSLGFGPSPKISSKLRLPLGRSGLGRDPGNCTFA